MPGMPACLKCPSGTFTAKPGGTAISNCSLHEAPVNYDALAAALVFSAAQNNSINGTILASGQMLLQAEVDLTQFNAELCATFLASVGAAFDQIGNGMCNYGPSNTAICGWDGGDCCEETCRPIEVSGCCAGIQCPEEGCLSYHLLWPDAKSPLEAI